MEHPERGSLLAFDADFEQSVFVEQEALHGPTEICQEMPPVRYLLSFWCSLSRSLRKCASAIPADDLHTWMGQQPLFEGLSFSVGQQVDGNPTFEIDEDSSIAPPAAETKIVHA